MEYLSVALLVIGIIGVYFTDKHNMVNKYHDRKIVFMDSLVWITIITGMVLTVFAYGWWSIAIILVAMLVSSYVVQKRRYKEIESNAKKFLGDDYR